MDTLPSLVTDLMHLKGQIVTMTTRKAIKVKAGYDPIFKESTFQCRVGVNYDNITAVQEKRDNGTLPSENQGLPWGKWAIFPYVITHNGNTYFRCTTFKGNATRNRYLTANGVPVPMETVKAHSYASEFSEKEKGDIFNMTVNNITHINGMKV